MIAIDAREYAREQRRAHQVPTKFVNLNLLDENQLGFTAFLASWFPLPGTLPAVYVEFEPLWLRSLCCRIALDYDAHKLPCNPYIFSWWRLLAIVVFLAFSLTALEHFSCYTKRLLVQLTSSETFLDLYYILYSATAHIIWWSLLTMW